MKTNANIVKIITKRDKVDRSSLGWARGNAAKAKRFERSQRRKAKEWNPDS